MRSAMAAEHATVLVVTALDEVAWLLNIRGSDVEYNPVWYVRYVGLAAERTSGGEVRVRELVCHVFPYVVALHAVVPASGTWS